MQQQEQQAEQDKQKVDKQKQMQSAKQATQQLLQQQLAAASNDTSTHATNQPPALTAAQQGQVDKYGALIKQAISQQWIIPDSNQKKLQTKLQVSVAPGGMVLNVTITQSSGDAAFDRSARAAVFKSSPLPVPNDPAVFNQFRILNFN